MTDKLDTAAIRAQLTAEADHGYQRLGAPTAMHATIIALCDAQDSLCNALDEARAENERLRGALKPFAEANKYFDASFDDDYAPRWAEFFTIGDFRFALAALTQKEKH